MNVLILGSGGREHVLAWKASQSKMVDKLFVSPGNAGTAKVAKNVALDGRDFNAIGQFCVNNNIDVLLPGSEDPLVAGIADHFENTIDFSHIFVMGPNKEAAQLEGSKEYAKEFMLENGIPTAQYQSFTSETLSEAKAYVSSKSGPYVLKADGLAAGKGVVIVDTVEEAHKTLVDMLLDSKFGNAGSTVVIEDFLEGVEFSVFVLSDGENYVILPEAKDYKRIGEGDTGLNTGGMGAVSPVPFVTDAYMSRVEEEIVKPTFEGLRKRNMKFVGFVFLGLINDNGNPKVIEYNVRMGDPETEVVFPRIENDFGELMGLTKIKRLNTVELKTNPSVCTTVFTVSGGYPEAYEKNKTIRFDNSKLNDQMVFHAGTKLAGDDIVTNGGRVIAVSSFGETIDHALSQSYAGVDGIEFEGKFFRRDIGQDLLNRSI